MQPSQLSMLPIYHISKSNAPVHFVHVIDVISIEYAKKFDLVGLYQMMVRLNARRAVRTAESQLAIWVPRGGIDSFSLLDERIPTGNKGESVLVHNNGSHFAMRQRIEPVSIARAA